MLYYKELSTKVPTTKMEKSNDIRSRLEELKISPDHIDDLIPLLTEERQPLDEEAALSVPELTDLRVQLALETDPIRRAVLAAKVISLQLDEGY